MLKNYIVSAIRSLKKKYGFTFINVFGLALGMATCLVISLYVNFDLSYDKFQDDNVYRIALNRVYPEREVDYTFIPHSIGPQLVTDFPEVEAQGRLFKVFNPNTVRFGEDMFIEEDVMFVDSTIFDVLNLEMITGDPKTALREQNSLVITESIAKKIFGDDEAIGKSLEFQGGPSRMVTAIVRDYPENSHIRLGYLIPMHSLGFFNQPNWTGFSALTYIKLRPGTQPLDFQDKLPSFFKQYADGEIQQRNGITYDEYIEAGNGYNYYLQNIKDIHLHSNIEGELKANGNINYIYIFSVVAVFILFIACINFMNLSTARSTERGKEVGIRKVLGSRKKQLVAQFLTESVIITILGAAMAFLMAYLILPAFNEIAGRSLTIEQLLTPINVGIMVVIVLIIGITAGIYPAFFISSFAPVAVLKGKLKNSQSGTNLRNVLVVLQFAISIALISATLLVYDQMNYMMNKPLGYNQESVVVINNVFALQDPNAQAINWDRFETFKDEINRLPGVVSASYTSAMPGDLLPGYIVRVPGNGNKESMVTRNITFHNDIIPALGMELVEGRFFDRNFNDSLSMILNESAVTKLGLSDPIGKKILEVRNDGVEVEHTIVGIIKDFHFQSLHVKMEPVAITSYQSANGFFAKAVVRVANDNLDGTLASIEGTWNQFVRNQPFQSYFLDANLREFYKAEQATGRIFSLFTVLAILIACIGLLGLSAFIINQRVKEIGVRKVLGASIPSIILLLSKDFTKLIAIAAVIAIPSSYLWMSKWLENFAYTSGINWLAFAIAATLALLIGFTTIGLQSVKAAMVNPVKSLKDE